MNIPIYDSETGKLISGDVIDLQEHGGKYTVCDGKVKKLEQFNNPCGTKKMKLKKKVERKRVKLARRRNRK